MRLTGSSLFLLILVVFITCCKDDESLPTSGKISGKVSASGIPPEQISIFIDDVFVSNPSASGEFSIDAAFGKHEFSATAGSDDQLFTVFSKEVIVSESDPAYDLGSLRLPEPPKLQIAFADFDSIVFVWNKSNAENFREYKFVLSNHLGTLEESGFHVSFTSSNDTTFTFYNDLLTENPLYPGRTYYCRVFVMDDSGKVAGSNLTTHKHEDPFDKPIAKLRQNMAFIAPHESNGVASDGQALWFSSFEFVRDSLFFQLYESTITKYNYQTGTVEKTIKLKFWDRIIGPIAFDNNGHLWGYLDHFDGGTVVQIDTAGSTIMNDYPADRSVVDLDVDDNGSLSLIDEWGHVTKISTSNGVLQEEFDLPLGGGWRGIATSSDEFWGIHWFLKKMMIFDLQGTFKGSVENSLLPGCDFCYGARFSLEFIDEAHVAVIRFDRVYILEIERL